MPILKSEKDGKYYKVALRSTDSHKSIVINAALTNGNFWVGDWGGKKFLLFECVWCKCPVTSSGVDGDHLVQQLMNKGSRSERALYRDLQGDSTGLLLSCSECNRGTRNSDGVVEIGVDGERYRNFNRPKTRSTYRGERELDQPIEVVDVNHMGE